MTDDVLDVSIGDVGAVLAAASGQTLLRTYAALTHRIHGAPRQSIYTTQLRTQRGLVEDEILRRMGGERA